MASTRLPGKILKLINSKPVLGYLIDRLKACKSLDEIIVATSQNEENDAIEEYCQVSSMTCFRGSEEDVLGRLVFALKASAADIGVLAFGDGPLVDPALVDTFVKMFSQDGSLDFLSNDFKTTYPPGMEVEVFKTAALMDAHGRNDVPATREHGTLYIRQHPELYKCKNVEAPSEQCRPELQLELDTIEDFTVIEAIIKHFSEKPLFSLSDMIDFLDQNDQLKLINKNVPRRWKSFRQT